MPEDRQLKAGLEMSTAAVATHPNSCKHLASLIQCPILEDVQALSHQSNPPVGINNRAHWPAVLLVIAGAHYRGKLSDINVNLYTS